MKNKLKCVWEIWLLDFVLPGFAKTLKTPENVAKKSQQFDWKTYVFIIFRASRKTLKTRNSRNSLHKRLCVWKNQIVEIVKRVSALVIPSRLYVYVECSFFVFFHLCCTGGCKETLLSIKMNTERHNLDVLSGPKCWGGVGRTLPCSNGFLPL